MIILAIDTSCDDTCLAILAAKRKEQLHFKILSNTISSQVKIHQKYGGVWPTLAKREHQKNLPIVFKKAMKEAKMPRIDLISVTSGPGLEPCLWVGVNFAKGLAKNLRLPIIPINHIEAHIFANFIGNLKSQISGYPQSGYKSLFPAICLVVSGGHTQLILMKNHLDYTILGETRDDAAGECFDKVARILGLGYPGGPAIAAEAAEFRIQNIEFRVKLPRPMIYQKNYDFSFSGLKTSVLYDFKNRSPKMRTSKIYIGEMAKEVQQAIIDVLIYKTLKAAKNYRAKSIILGGGVAANEELRNQFKKIIKKQLPNTLYLIPNTSLCTDNATMVAVAAFYHWLSGKRENWKNIKANANLRLGQTQE